MFYHQTWFHDHLSPRRSKTELHTSMRTWRPHTYMRTDLSSDKYKVLGILDEPNFLQYSLVKHKYYVNSANNYINMFRKSRFTIKRDSKITYHCIALKHTPHINQGVVVITHWLPSLLLPLSTFKQFRKAPTSKYDPISLHSFKLSTNKKNSTSWKARQILFMNKLNNVILILFNTKNKWVDIGRLWISVNFGHHRLLHYLFLK